LLDSSVTYLPGCSKELAMVIGTSNELHGRTLQDLDVARSR
jgi:hypothetical protein